MKIEKKLFSWNREHAPLNINKQWVVVGRDVSSEPSYRIIWSSFCSAHYTNHEYSNIGRIATKVCHLTFSWYFQQRTWNEPKIFCLTIPDLYELKCFKREGFRNSVNHLKVWKWKYYFLRLLLKNRWSMNN